MELAEREMRSIMSGKVEKEERQALMVKSGHIVWCFTTGGALDHQARSLSNRCNVQQVQGHKLHAECNDMSFIYYLNLAKIHKM